MIKKILATSLFLILLVSLVFVVKYENEVNWRTVSDKTVQFSVKKGESISQIGQNLSDLDLIRSKFFFELYLKLKNQQTKIQAGDYLLPGNQSIKAIIDKLVSGQTKQVRLLIKEGETELDISQDYEKSGLGQAVDFLKVTGQPLADNQSGFNAEASSSIDWLSSYGFLADKPKGDSLEGFLFPDTYLLAQNARPEQLVKKMLDNFNQKLSPNMRSEIASQGKSIFEIVTMASVVEKEVKSPEDMKLVAGIFWKRIANRQPLQSDATLSYLLNDRNAAHSATDLSLDSPYNSYKYRGLPPTPICNPGLNAIIAAIYPVDSDYNYFLTSSIDGQTKFAKTFEEHKKNKALYLK